MGIVNENTSRTFVRPMQTDFIWFISAVTSSQLTNSISWPSSMRRMWYDLDVDALTHREFPSLYAELLTWSGTSVQVMRYRHNYTHVFVVRPIGKNIAICDAVGERTNNMFCDVCQYIFSWCCCCCMVANAFVYSCFASAYQVLDSSSCEQFHGKLRGELGIFRLMRRW